MTLAAMLLLSIGAFAQIDATLKGDVNGDGKVDVEDVTSLVDIILTGKTYGYFYFGTTQPTAENYQMLSGLVASYTSINDAIGATSSIDAGEVLYMLCPATWTKGKKVVVEDGAGGSYNFIEDVDAETVSGYVIYRTEAWEEATDLTLNFEITGGDEYFWYVGTSTTPPTADNYTTILTQVDENDNPYTFTNTNVRHYMYIVVRDTKSVVSITDGEFITPYREYTNISIPGYKVYRSNGPISVGGSEIITIE